MRSSTSTSTRGWRPSRTTASGGRRRALTWHKEYWTATEARSRSGEGLLAFGPLALACLARDAGMEIRVESEYLPKELLEFGWAGEVDA
ncbi:immunity 49 family protein [Streptomyces sp. NPDC047976]|uniref:immunity 49 family protein n=1 Tax=Streptomyces sp. NPDC047976 TaxID=3155746 RepID=UPI003420D040